LTNVFRHFGLLQGPVEAIGRQLVIRSMEVVRARRAGLVHLKVALNDTVEKADHGDGHQHLRELVEELRAPPRAIVRIATFRSSMPASASFRSACRAEEGTGCQVPDGSRSGVVRTERLSLPAPRSFRGEPAATLAALESSSAAMTASGKLLRFRPISPRPRSWRSPATSVFSTRSRSHRSDILLFTSTLWPKDGKDGPLRLLASGSAYFGLTPHRR